MLLLAAAVLHFWRPWRSAEPQAPQADQHPAAHPGPSGASPPAQHPAAQPARAQPVAGEGEGQGVLPADLQPPPPTATESSHRVQDAIATAAALAQANRPVAARAAYNAVLFDPGASSADRAGVRIAMTALNQLLVFSPAVLPNDPLVRKHTVQPNERMAAIVKSQNLHIDWRFIARITGIDPLRMQVGQELKLVQGPFHAVIHKDTFRLDLYAELPAEPIATSAKVRSKPELLFITSYPVGLGAHGSTPVGDFVIRQDSKLINPPWTNPRTGESFSANNPANPIGERWIGLRGVGPETQKLHGYGIHGTIHPDSIGSERSMGCVRMRSEDVAVVYELLEMGTSRVRIVSGGDGG